jgi:hypothetical protein
MRRAVRPFWRLVNASFQLVPLLAPVAFALT